MRARAAGLPAELAARYHLAGFASGELPDVLALADVVVSRCGAGTLAELTALGKPQRTGSWTRSCRLRRAGRSLLGLVGVGSRPCLGEGLAEGGDDLVDVRLGEVLVEGERQDLVAGLLGRGQVAPPLGECGLQVVGRIVDATPMPRALSRAWTWVRAPQGAAAGLGLLEVVELGDADGGVDAGHLLAQAEAVDLIAGRLAAFGLGLDDAEHPNPADRVGLFAGAGDDDAALPAQDRPVLPAGSLLSRELP